jgi:hypothetical protein
MRPSFDHKPSATPLTYPVCHQIATATAKPSAMSITGQSIQFNIPPHRYQQWTTNERDVWITESQIFVAVTSGPSS